MLMMDLPKKSYAQIARSYMGGLAHVHTRLSNHPGHRESDLTVNSLMALLGYATEWTAGRPPLEYILFNEHSSNPDSPRPLGALSLRARKLLGQRRTKAGSVPLFYGLEVSLLADGTTDLVPRLADNCAVVIASRHRLPVASEYQPAAIMEMFEKACANPVVDVLGHPARNIERLEGVNWRQIFVWARESGTAIEVNLNTFPRSEAEKTRMDFWAQWTHLLGESGADVFMGTDLHNGLQVRWLREQWAQLDDMSKRNPLRSCLDMLGQAGIGPERVVNRSAKSLRDWMTIDKTARSPLLLV